MSTFQDEDMSVSSYSTREDFENKNQNTSSTELSSAQPRRPTTVTSGSAQEAEAWLKNDERVRLLRDVGIMMLLLTAAFASAAVYMSLRASEQREFESKFTDQAAQVGRGLNSQLVVKLRAIDALSATITSYVGAKETSWPNVTLPDFSFRSAIAIRNGGGVALGLHPIVNAEHRGQWENFSFQAQSWRKDGLEFQKKFQNTLPADGLHVHDDEGNPGHRDQVEEFELQTISKYIFQIEDGIPRIVGEEAKVMLPLWQHTPVHDGLPMVNYDIYRKRNRRNLNALNEVMENGVSILGQFFDLAQSFHGRYSDTLLEDYDGYNWTAIWNGEVDIGIEGNNTRLLSRPDRTNPDAVIYTDELNDTEIGYINPSNTHSSLEGPATNIWYPVFSELSGENRTVAAIISMTARWDSFLLPILPPDAKGLIVVISNACRQYLTFEITGNEVAYLGPEDYHELKYDVYKTRFDLETEGSGFMKIPLSREACAYRATIYPSAKMRKAFETNTPVALTVSVVFVFLFTLFIFTAYDYLVQRRQNVLASVAHRSTTIVSALFPKIVRDRLFDDSKKPMQEKRGTMQFSAPTHNGDANRGAKSAPIADLFTNTTVMFGDIAGFTAWSSSRQPTEVFILLETLYGAFDKIAKDMDVFKVETIGDCYVAVTGLPHAQADHHLRMVKFSRHVLQKTSVLTREMEVELGPDTTNLGFRIGLHSGPVTAGVLRGEKSRFQLFGDTVNTASRMESTGKQNQIQVSQSTADLIAASGKGHWMRKRDELVQAKGKGLVQTYWVRSKVSSSEKIEEDLDLDILSPSGRRVSTSSVVFERKDTESHEAAHRNTIRQSLIDWQVELLSRLLKQIVLQRDMSNNNKTKPIGDAGIPKMLPRDEIAEKIVMPAFDSKIKQESMDIGSVELPAVVLSQLNDLVTTIALLYHENSFHNYEHACHVTMSANKLLQRIVIPSTKEKKEKRKQAHEYTFGLTSDPLTQFAIVFSAIIHDLDHHGVSNQQLVKEKNRLSVMYDDKSVAEQNSIDLAFEVLTSPSYSDLVSCICDNEDDYKRFRQLVINCVMATDIFDNDLLSFRNNRWQKAFSGQDASQSDLKATIVIEHIIQAADVAHTMQHWHVYQRWNEKLFIEMKNAYESGRGPEKDPALSWYQGELWFFDNYVIPLAKKLDDCGVFGVSSDECFNYARENRKEWESKGRGIVEEMANRYKREENEEDRKEGSTSSNDCVFIRKEGAGSFQRYRQLLVVVMNCDLASGHASI
eukprot:scaffold10332_cov101-Cylindrotheca_fusiformis.AAC.2